MSVVRVTLAALFLSSLLGCGTSKEPGYFALEPRPGSPHNKAPPLVELRRPTLAGYLDRADIVTGVKDYRLRIDTNERWAEPLGDMIGRVLARDLSNRLTASHVFTETGGFAAVPDAVIAVDVLTFDSGEARRVTLVAQVAIETKGNAAPQLETFTLAANAEDGSTASLVATMSALLGELSDRIARMLGGG